jgi:hypothetical protein
VTLVVASVVGAVVVADGPGAGEALDLTGLAAAGALVDERAPDRFERVADGRSGGDPLLRVGPVVHSHGSLLVAARSLAQAAGIGLDDRLLVDLAAGTAVEVVAGLLVPCLTGAATWAAGGGVGPGEVAPGRGPTFAATGASAASTAPVPLPVAAPPRRRLRRRPPTVAPRAVQVAGHGGGPLDGAGANGLAVEAAGGLVTGFGRPGTLGRPLPGTSVAIDDDGTVLVRRGAVAPGAPGLREDGWLATGLTGSLDDGHLVLDGAAPG